MFQTAFSQCDICILSENALSNYGICSHEKKKKSIRCVKAFNAVWRPGWIHSVEGCSGGSGAARRRRSGWGGGRGGRRAGRGAQAGRENRFGRRTRVTASQLCFLLLLLPASPSTLPSPCSVAVQSLWVLQHFLDERRHGAGNLHLQCDHSLRSWDRGRERTTGSVTGEIYYAITQFIFIPLEFLLQ